MRVEAINSLGASANAIAVPWRDANGEEYLDLREDPGAISRIAVAREHTALAGFLAAVNGPGSLFNSVRVKAWPEVGAQGGAESRFHSRVDLIFTHESFNSSSERYEDVVRRLVELWMRDASGDALSVRLEILPCRYGDTTSTGAVLRLILTARGANPEQAVTRWALGIVRVQQALLFVSRAIRQKLGIDG